ncbi:hypothetical protein VP489E541_P0008 [Vibrio phage 489E54-1]|nr:hypothetical protein VP489E541_P0008 [Vibrio phage 489E54-1]
MSTKISIGPDSWTKLTNGEKSGSYLVSNGVTVVVVQSSTEPSDVAAEAARMDSTASDRPRPFSNLGSEFLYARTVKGTAILHLTLEG